MPFVVLNMYASTPNGQSVDADHNVILLLWRPTERIAEISLKYLRKYAFSIIIIQSIQLWAPPLITICAKMILLICKNEYNTLVLWNFLMKSLCFVYKTIHVFAIDSIFLYANFHEGTFQVDKENLTYTR